MLSREFFDMEVATEHIKKILAELPQSFEFIIVHSISSNKCDERSGDWNTISSILLDYLRDLDSQQGLMTHEEGYWDFSESEDDDYSYESFYLYSDDVTVEAGEGVVVLYNDKAVSTGEFPIIVVKKSIWDRSRWGIQKLLNNKEENEDYTSKITPALYIELV